MLTSAASYQSVVNWGPSETLPVHPAYTLLQACICSCMSSTRNSLSLEALRPVFHFAACNTSLLHWFAFIPQDLYKANGNVHSLGSYMETSDLPAHQGKHYTKGFHVEATPLLNPHILGSMCDGLLKRGTDSRSHALRALASIAQEHWA